MGANAAENTNLRLKAVLDVLTEGVWSGEKLNAGVVLGEAIARVPLNDHERELLSGGIPRGHKALTSATAKLVKAGWLVKGRSGWTITEDGQRATVAFADPTAFTAALDAGTPVPAGTPLPSAPATKRAPRAKAAKTAPKAVKVAEEVAEKVAGLVEEVVAPVAKAVRKRKAAAASPASEAPAPAAAETVEQPAEVAVAGDFNVLLGAPANWAPQYDESQMQLDEVDQLWKLAADLPAGSYSFKIAINRSWDENYGAFGVFDGANHEVHHRGGLLVIRYDHRTRDIVSG
ncbi:glycosidase [Arthrobacter sp. UKPF54-2]|uniref:pullulanase X25 domain-containing protein n=1 Tax=Arthrobacter sp. UKPF54-2 TaxID=2600159 RepID=UPI0011B1BE62|nr:glycosidase [Arthrobacter sp. UKPF54-2]QDY89098.1 glycosidase [Arthrobacter sp. UKPF54-2]